MPDAPAGSGTIDALLQETRKFPPPPEFAKDAVAAPGIHEKAAADPLAFWAEQARHVDWAKPYDQILEWNAPHAKWFLGGQLNASYNCVDRHLSAGRRTRAAIIWEGEPDGEQRVLTYQDLYREVNRAAHAIRALGVEKGDRVAIYMPMVPEAVIAMLACARIGAIHSVVFGGFAPQELAARIDDAAPKVVLSASCGVEPSRVVPDV